MISNGYIQFKAAFLMVVFSMNTLVGFACSMGVDMGFNKPQDSQEGKERIHIHKDGKKHDHKAAAEKEHHAHGPEATHHGKEANGEIHMHKDGKKHVHKPATEKNHHAKRTTGSKKDDCCKEKVVKLQTADKNFQFTKTSISAPVYIITENYLAPVTFKAVHPELQEYVACHFHPPPRDIRVDIQSFQI